MRLVQLFTTIAGLILVSACQTETKQPDSRPTDAGAVEQHRSTFHFMPPAKWMNDPNGMVYFEGEYHFFYQHYPDSSVWGPMHWGHAVSTDLVHWQHLPIALYPDSLGLIFSGSTVVDWNNTSGLGEHGKPPMVAIFTHHLMAGEQAGRNDFQYQSIAYSNDRGRTWTKYAGNPVIPNLKAERDFRDPKVIWDEGSKQWVMVLAAKDRIQLWGSPNLKNWTYLSDFGEQYGVHAGVWECPDLFPIKVENEEETKWVLLSSINPGGPNGGSGTQYFVGDFDGKNFHLDPAFATTVRGENAVWLDYGRDNYAGVTWSDVPASDGRRLFIGWMSNWDYANVVPTVSWRSSATLPRSLHLHKKPAGYRLVSHPVAELVQLRKDTLLLDEAQWKSAADIGKMLNGHEASQWEVELELLLKEKDTHLGLRLGNDKDQTFVVGYDGGTKHYYSDRRQAGKQDFSDRFATQIHKAPRQSDSDTIRLHLFIDRASCELFADNGETVMTEIFFPDEDFNSLGLFVENGGFRVLHSAIYPLSDIWKNGRLAQRK